MEIKKRKTLGKMFFMYSFLFCVCTLLLTGLVVLLFQGFCSAGLILPANDTEQRLKEVSASLAAADEVTREMLPGGCSYGVYVADGTFLYGTFTGAEQQEGWQDYKEKKRTDGAGMYYDFILRKDGGACLVKYKLESRFAGDSREESLLSPVLVFFLLYIFLFLLQTLFLSRCFGKKLTRRLRTLKDTTEKIQRQDLEFERTHSDIQEIEETLTSLYHMKCALQDSLTRQWEAEEERRSQTAALAHDIKTPLTVIRGNVELLQEEACGDAENYSYILQSVKELEDYVAALQDVLSLWRETGKEKPEPSVLSAGELAERLIRRAEMLAPGRLAEVRMQAPEGEIRCHPGQIQRAWDNIVENALEYAPEGSSIRVTAEKAVRQGKCYLALSVTDRGEGFTEEGLRHAAEQFYQGDKSRGRKGHQGLGLSIAAGFARAQGGDVLLENAGEDGWGAEVTLLAALCLPEEPADA